MGTIKVTGRDYHAGKMTIFQVKRALRRARKDIAKVEKLGILTLPNRYRMLREKVNAFEHRLEIAQQGNLYHWAGMLSAQQCKEQLVSYQKL